MAGTNERLVTGCRYHQNCFDCPFEDCIKDYTDDKEDIRDSAKDFKDYTVEELLILRQDYSRDSKEYIKYSSRIYYLRNKDRRNEYALKYYAEHKEHLNKIGRERKRRKYWEDKAKLKQELTSGNNRQNN